MDYVLFGLLLLGPILMHLWMGKKIRGLVAREPKVAWLRHLPKAGLLTLLLGVPAAMGIYFVWQAIEVASATGAERATQMAQSMSNGLNCGVLVAPNLVYLAFSVVVLVVGWRLPVAGRPDAF
ncbi:MAG: hypothetical protein H6723_19540 [Sandaracinus sp.]|nr:hypothetical protein [Sandaracinus sp.]